MEIAHEVDCRGHLWFQNHFLTSVTGCWLDVVEPPGHVISCRNMLGKNVDARPVVQPEAHARGVCAVLSLIIGLISFCPFNILFLCAFAVPGSARV